MIASLENVLELKKNISDQKWARYVPMIMSSPNIAKQCQWPSSSTVIGNQSLDYEEVIHQLKLNYLVTMVRNW